MTGYGKHFEHVSRWLAKLIKEDGNWKLYRIQSTINPVDNVFVEDTVKYTRLFVDGGGLVIGALLGLFSLDSAAEPFGKRLAIYSAGASRLHCYSC